MTRKVAANRIKAVFLTIVLTMLSPNLAWAEPPKSLFSVCKAAVSKFLNLSPSQGQNLKVQDLSPEDQAGLLDSILNGDKPKFAPDLSDGDLQRLKGVLKRELGPIGFTDVAAATPTRAYREVMGEPVDGTSMWYWRIYLNGANKSATIWVPITEFKLNPIFRIDPNIHQIGLTKRQTGDLITAVIRYFSKVATTAGEKAEIGLFARLNEALVEKGYYIHPEPTEFGGFAIQSMDDWAGQYQQHIIGPFYMNENWMAQWSDLPVDLRQLLLSEMPENWFVNSLRIRIQRIVSENPARFLQANPNIRFVQDWLLIPENIRQKAENRLPPSVVRRWRELVRSNLR